MLLDTSYDCYQLPLPGQDQSYFSPTPSQPSPSSNSVFHFPPPVFPYSDPPSSPWKMPTLELTGSLCGLDNTSTSPMVLSPPVSNLNTPRVSISSHGGSDLGLRIRSSHSSLHSNSNHGSPLGFSVHQQSLGTFGHSMSQSVYSDSQNFSYELDFPQATSRYSSPQDYYRPEPPSYEETLHNQIKMEPLSSLPPPYPYTNTPGPVPKLEPCTALTPDPDSVMSERNTPDSSIKDEPSEEASEGGVMVCRWRNCGREFLDQAVLVSHITESHVDQKKGCEDFPCMWEVSQAVRLSVRTFHQHFPSLDLSQEVEAFQCEVQVGDAHEGSHWRETLCLRGE